MNGGIDQLVDTYKGNPQPLQEKVQKAQQGQPPGKVPPDLEEAIALQKIAELRNSAQGQQAMQAGGAQQSIVDKLKQMLGGMQPQAQVAQGAPAQQGQPVMAARGGSIDQLMSNLGRYYAGGGIVAFNGKEDSDVKDEDVKKKLQQYTLQQQGADWVARKQAERLANAKEDGSSLPQFIQDIAKLPQFMPDIAKLPQAFDDWKQRAREQDAINAAADRRMAKYKEDVLAAKQKTSLANYLVGSPEREKEGLAKLEELSKAPLPKTPVGDLPASKAAPLDAETQKLLNLAASRSQTGVSTNPALMPKPSAAPAANVPAAPRPSANVAAPAAPAKPAVEPMDPMETALRKSIMDALAKDPEAIRKKAMEQNAQFMGLDALLKPAQDRAAAREARIKEIQDSRQPLWIDALMSAGKPTRGGIAGVLQNMAVGAISGKQNYDAEDLKFLDELNKLNSEIDKARIEGRYKDVAAGKEAVKDLIAEQRQAEQSGTSLLNTKELARSREQAANIAAQARRDAAAARGAGAGAGDKQQLNELKALQTSLKDQLKDPRMMGKAGDSLRAQLAIVNAEIAKMAGLSTMAAAPGAASPGGTRPPLSSFQR